MTLIPHPVQSAMHRELATPEDKMYLSWLAQILPGRCAQVVVATRWCPPSDVCWFIHVLFLLVG
jgi:hypothetical protein